MKLTPIRTVLLLVLALAALGATGCMSDDDDSAGAGPGTTTMEMTEAVSIEGAAVDLRVTLDRLLGEHAMLAAFAMQKGFAGEKDFEAIAGALEANTVDLGAAIGSVYGDEAEQAFLEQWREHIGFFVDLTVATAKKDDAGRKAALDKLAGYRASFASFLDKATDGNLPAKGAADALQAHVDQLTGALDQYAAGDYPKAYATLREAYAHMYMTADAITGGIVAQSPDEYTS